jgi:amino acid transporter
MREIKIWHAVLFLFVVIFGCIAFVMLDKYFEGQYRFLFLGFVALCFVVGISLMAFFGSLQSREWIRTSKRRPLSKDPVWYISWIVCILVTAVWIMWILEEAQQDSLVRDFGFHMVLLRPAYLFWIIIPIYWRRYKKREKFDEKQKKTVENEVDEYFEKKPLEPQ